MTTRAPKPKGTKPAHQNSVAFKHNKHSKKTAKILASPNQGLCQRCHDIIEWRKKYRKYKPLKAPSKCQHCDQRKVTRAYHVLCDDCAKLLKVCGKCREGKEIIQETITEQEKQRQAHEELVMVDCMRERERRTYLRHRFAGKEGEDDEGEDDEGEGSGEDLSNSDEENHPDGDQQDDQLEEDEIDDTKNPSDTGLEPRVENLDLSEESDEEE